MRPLGWSALLLILGIAVGNAAAQTADELLTAARTALSKGEIEPALTALGKAIALDPKNAKAYFLRGAVYETLRRNPEALADLSKTIELDAKTAEAYDRRGSVQFKLGRFRESLADFDQYLKLQPQASASHWRRGITCYYAGQFDEGRKQFEGYEKVDTNDVENAVWHFLCVARASGVDKARAGMLKIGKDVRVPMMEVYALYGGKAQPADVLTAAEAAPVTAEQRSFRLFYAHLYLGLYYEVAADKKKALEHMTLAAEKYRIRQGGFGPMYMGDVAQVHLDVLRKDAK